MYLSGISWVGITPSVSSFMSHTFLQPLFVFVLFVCFFCGVHQLFLLLRKKYIYICHRWCQPKIRKPQAPSVPIRVNPAVITLACSSPSVWYWRFRLFACSSVIIVFYAIAVIVSSLLTAKNGRKWRNVTRTARFCHAATGCRHGSGSYVQRETNIWVDCCSCLTSPL